MKYFVPSKTFLAGEYSVLVGGRALGLATKPCFEIEICPRSQDGTGAPEISFHAESPAGLYLRNHGESKISETGGPLSIGLFDPYAGQGVQGGFGKSTAEYLAVALPEMIRLRKSVREVRAEYVHLFKNTKNVKPSGVDLAFQCLGQVAYVDQNRNEFQSDEWRFDDLDFIIISTGLKIQTHAHLESLSLPRLAELPFFSDRVIDAYLNQSSAPFLNAMKDWVLALNANRLTDPAALSIQRRLEKIKHVDVVKPCGALGADVMLIFCDSKNTRHVLASLKNEGFKIQATSDDLTEGLLNDVV